MTRRRTLIAPDPQQEEPGVYEEESGKDMVATWFDTKQGKRDIAK